MHACVSMYMHTVQSFVFMIEPDVYTFELCLLVLVISVWTSCMYYYGFSIVESITKANKHYEGVYLHRKSEMRIQRNSGPCFGVFQWAFYVHTCLHRNTEQKSAESIPSVLSTHICPVRTCVL